jgi:hypothetical protein
MEIVGIFYGHLVYLINFIDILYILWKFGIFFPVLVYCTKKPGNPAAETIFLFSKYLTPQKVHT